MRRVTAAAPGKLFLAGEYAVVTPGEPALLVAVNRYIRVTVSANPAATDSGTPPVKSPHVAAAEQVFAAYLRHTGVPERPYRLSIESELNAANGHKYGLGSSGAVVVATVRALAEFYALSLPPVTQLQLALLATVTVSAGSSGGDVAASCWGGYVRYHSPDRALIAAAYREGGIAAALKPEVWRGLKVAPFAPAAATELLVGWTGSPVSTDAQLAGVGGLKRSASARPFLERSAQAVTKLQRALIAGDIAAQRAACAAAREALIMMCSAAGIVYETEPLKRLNDLAIAAGAAAKTSGAGGGDCGIALATAEQRPAILAAWANAQIKHLDLGVAPAKGLGCEF